MSSLGRKTRGTWRIKEQRHKEHLPEKKKVKNHKSQDME